METRLEQASAAYISICDKIAKGHRNPNFDLSMWLHKLEAAKLLCDTLSICTCPSGDGSLRWPCPVHPIKPQVLGVDMATQPDMNTFAESTPSGIVYWRPMHTAPRDGSMLRLLVLFTEHSTEDNDYGVTIGAWPAEGDDDAEWQFAGWCWTHDHFTEGKGVPVGWLPLIGDDADAAHSRPQFQQFAGVPYSPSLVEIGLPIHTTPYLPPGFVVLMQSGRPVGVVQVEK